MSKTNSVIDNESSSCVSEVTLAINKKKSSVKQQKIMNTTELDSPDSIGSGENSNSFTVQPFESTDEESQNGNAEFQESFDCELRIPIIGYEVMEERARFTVN